MIIKVVFVLIGVFILIQLVPYGKDHRNPPVTHQVAFDSPRTQELFRRSCIDCHSHETKWPWYSNVAPVSWFVYHHVIEGRSKFNVSVNNQEENEAQEAAEEFKEGEMPIKSYLAVHPEARLTNQEREDFLKGLVLTFGQKDHKVQE